MIRFLSRRATEAIMAAKHLLKARILLKADVSQSGEGCSDNQSVEALETRTVQDFILHGRAATDTGRLGGTCPKCQTKMDEVRIAPLQTADGFVSYACWACSYTTSEILPAREQQARED